AFRPRVHGCDQAFAVARPTSLENRYFSSSSRWRIRRFTISLSSSELLLLELELELLAELALLPPCNCHSPSSSRRSCMPTLISSVLVPDSSLTPLPLTSLIV